MDEEELKAKLEGRIANSIGRQGDTISNQREEALRRYNAFPYGDEKPNRSSVLTTECRDTVAWLLPSIIKTFLASDKIVEFMPNAPGMEELADQQTDVVNYMVMQRNDSFNIFHTWFLDALMMKTGYIKYGHEVEKTVKREVYTGIDEMSYAKLLEDNNIEIVNENMRGEQIESMQGLINAPVFDVEIERTTSSPKYFIENIPPERVLVDANATSIEDALFIGLIYYKTRSDLIKMGYPRAVVDELPKGDSTGYGGEETTREQVNGVDGTDNSDEDYIEIIECYTKIDKNGDGIEELRRIVVAGESSITILEDEEVEDVNLAKITPFPKPYSFFGESMVDRIKDLQRISTTLNRLGLDSLYNTAAPMWEVLEQGVVNLKDVTQRVPGGIIRVKSQLGAIKPVINSPMPPELFNYLDRLRDTKDVRTGVIALNQGLDPNAINKTATGVLELQEAGRQVQELIVRNFAETGMKRLFKGIYGLIVKYQDQPLTVRLRNKWVTVDPRDWEEQVNVVVNVGLGTASSRIKSGELQGILEKQIDFMGMGLSNPSQIYNTLAKMVNSAGYKEVNSFFTDPSTLPPPPPPEPKLTPEEVAMAEINSNVEKANIKAQSDKYDTDVKAEVDLIKNQTDAELKLLALQGKDNNRDMFPGVPD